MQTLQQLDLRKLAQMESDRRAFVSCYMSVNRDDPTDMKDTIWLEHRADEIDNLLDDEPETQKHFRSGMDMIRTWLKENRPTGKSVAIFASDEHDFVKGVDLPVKVERRLNLGPAPIIRPLVEIEDEFENFVFVTASNKTTTIHFVSGAMVRDTEALDADIKQKFRGGGWSHRRFQKRHENQVDLFGKEIAGQLYELSKDQRFDRIVLLGSVETRKAILDKLHDSLRAKVIADEPAQLQQSEQDLLKLAEKYYFEAEREDERSLWERIKAQNFEQGLAVTGPDQVWMALANGRAEEIAINRDRRLTGIKCRECGNVTPEQRGRCRFCNAENIYEIDLVDEIARQAERTSAAVDFVEPIAGLEKVGGVAALLRY